MEDSLGTLDKVCVRVRRAEGLEKKMILAGLELRAHGGNVQVPPGVFRCDNPLENHGLSAPRKPDALTHVSRYSSSGFESATMPPPTGNCTQPPAMVKVRINMLMSM